MSKIYLSWEDFSKHIRDINKAIDFSSIDLIVGIANGGVLPANELAALNSIKMLPIKCSFRDAPDEEQYKKDLQKIKQYDNILIVDDIYDSGKTVHKIREDLKNKNIKFYTIYSTDENAVEYFSIKKETDDWIVFPWENDTEKN